MSIIFKARYFPNSNVLMAGKRSGTSFLWSGIWTTKEGFFKGFRWVIGKGTILSLIKILGYVINVIFMLNKTRSMKGGMM